MPDDTFKFKSYHQIVGCVLRQSPVVNFTNILSAAFLREIFVVRGLLLFWRKNSVAKAALKMMVNLTPGSHVDNGDIKIRNRRIRKILT